MTLTERRSASDTIVNLSTEDWKGPAIRFSTLRSHFAALSCQPGDILEFLPDSAAAEPMRAA